MKFPNDKVNTIEKRYAFMRMLESIGAFTLKNGNITIHFDNLGCVAKVEKHEAFKVYEA
jgi:hypothetical protein